MTQKCNDSVNIILITINKLHDCIVATTIEITTTIEIIISIVVENEFQT